MNWTNLLMSAGRLFQTMNHGKKQENSYMDDTIIKKTGKHIPGTSWRRDPLGPAFHTNVIWGQRFLQISLALPRQCEMGQSRAIPVDFHHCPTALRPKKNAGEYQLNQYKEEKKKGRFEYSFY